MGSILYDGKRYFAPNEEQGEIIRENIRDKISEIKDAMDSLLAGVGLESYKEFILFMTNKSELPHWYRFLLVGERPSLQNVKAIGTMIEYLFACVIKTLIVDNYVRWKI